MSSAASLNLGLVQNGVLENGLKAFIAKLSAAAATTNDGYQYGDEYNATYDDPNNGGDGEKQPMAVFFVTVVSAVIVFVAQHVVFDTSLVGTLELVMGACS